MNKNANISGKVYHATKWSVITNVLRKTISPIVNLILARILLPEIFGVVATINIVISFADIFTDAGFQKYLIQHEFGSDKDLEKATNVAFWTNFILSVCVWATIFLFRNSLAHLVGSDGYGLHICIAALSIPLLSFSSIQQARFKRDFDFKSMFVPRIINSIIPFFVTIPLAVLTKSCWSLIIGTLASHLSDAIFLTLKSRWKPSLYYRFSILKDMLSFSIWTFFETLSIWLTVNIDVFLLGTMISDHYLGLYKTSLTTINQITNLITTTIVPILFAALSRTQSDDALFKDTYYDFLEKTSILLIPMSVGIFLFKDTITFILLGKNWMEASFFIGLIGLMQAITVLISHFASEVYRSKGDPKVSFFVQVAFILVLAPMILFGASRDFHTLCFLKAFSLLIFALMHCIILKFKYHFLIREIFRKTLYPLFFSIIMAGFAILYQSLWKSFVASILGILLCMLLYGILCLCFSSTKKILFELKSIFSKNNQNS